MPCRAKVDADRRRHGTRRRRHTRGAQPSRRPGTKPPRRRHRSGMRPAPAARTQVQNGPSANGRRTSRSITGRRRRSGPRSPRAGRHRASHQPERTSEPASGAAGRGRASEVMYSTYARPALGRQRHEHRGDVTPTVSHGGEVVGGVTARSHAVDERSGNSDCGSAEWQMFWRGAERMLSEGSEREAHVQQSSSRAPGDRSEPDGACARLYGAVGRSSPRSPSSALAAPWCA